MVKYVTPWGRAVKHAMIDHDLTMTDLAKELNMSRSYLSGIVNGRTIAPDVITRINDYLQISVPHSVAGVDTPSEGAKDSMIEDSSEQSLPMYVPEAFADDDIDGMSETKPRVEIYADDSHLLDEAWW